MTRAPGRETRPVSTSSPKSFGLQTARRRMAARSAANAVHNRVSDASAAVRLR